MVFSERSSDDRHHRNSRVRVSVNQLVDDPKGTIDPKTGKVRKVEKDFATYWGDEQRGAVAAVKQAMTSYPVLRQPDPSRPFVGLQRRVAFSVKPALPFRCFNRTCRFLAVPRGDQFCTARRDFVTP